MLIYSFILLLSISFIFNFIYYSFNFIFLNTYIRISNQRGSILQTSAITLQRVYRGWYSRKYYSAYVLTRKNYLDFRKSQDYIRENHFYRFLEFFGFAPILVSDSPYERILKQFPKYFHVVLAGERERGRDKEDELLSLTISWLLKIFFPIYSNFCYSSILLFMSAFIYCILMKWFIYFLL